MANRQVRLFYFPTSYFSQMAVIALKEKDVKFEPVVVNLLAGEQLEAWYMRINSLGEVPALQDGDKIIKDSSTIIDYIDKEFPSDSKLVPDMSTEMGKEVSKWRGVLSDVQVYAVTFGTMCYPDLSLSGIKLPKTMQKSKTDITASNQIMGKKAEQLADEHPDLREFYMAKAAACQKRPEVLSKENVTKALEELDAIMDKVEEQLKKVEADPSKELWFCGQQFTAADITLCVLLARLQLLGQGERYHSAEKRPCLHAYWEQAKKRPSIKRHSVNVSRYLMQQKMKEGAKVVLPVLGGVLALGLAAGLVFVFAQKR